MKKKQASICICILTLIICAAIYICPTPISTLSYYGSRGQEVISIQTKLKNWGYYNGSIDGIYGPNTYSAVKLFQTKNGLKVDGVAGAQTLAGLGLSSAITASTGNQIKDIQIRLKNWGYYNGSIDGIYGPKTYSAVRLFQQRNGLKVDGIVGPQTLAALGLPTGTASYTASSRNVNLMAHLIYGEARGESYKGQVAIGAVVLNRVQSPKFPNTIAGVIYQPGAFTAVSDGQINLSPDNDAYNAARDALNGWDPTNGCIYYFNPATATSSWIWSRPQVTQIGKHIFAK